MKSFEQFREDLRRTHAEAFRLHEEVALYLEPFVTRERSHDTAVELAVDMLMIQAFKAHTSVLAVVELGHLEDAATLTRRVLELAVTAVFLHGDSDEEVRLSRASRFIADLWDRLEKRGVDLLPEEVCKQWQAIHDSAGPLPANRKRWGPTMKEMFEYAQLESTYREDYSFLSNIAHGSSEEQILKYSADRIRIRNPEHVGTMLVYASRYYASVAEMWNRAYGFIDSDWFERTAEALTGWAPKAERVGGGGPDSG